MFEELNLIKNTRMCMHAQVNEAKCNCPQKVEMQEKHILQPW